MMTDAYSITAHRLGCIQQYEARTAALLINAATDQANPNNQWAGLSDTSGAMPGNTRNIIAFYSGAGCGCRANGTRCCHDMGRGRRAADKMKWRNVNQLTRAAEK